MDCCLFTYPFFCQWLFGLFLIIFITNSAASAMLAHISWYLHTVSPGLELLSHTVFILQGGWTYSCACQKCLGVHIAYLLTNPELCQTSINVCPFGSCKMSLIILLCIFWLKINVEDPSTCLFNLMFSVFVNDSSLLFAHIYIALSSFLLIYRGFLYLLDTDPLLSIGEADSFSYLVD